MATATFQEFLKDLEARERKPDVLARRNEWLEAVDRLLAQIEGWLKELDPTGVFEVYRRPVERVEAGLGHYTAPSLVIAVGEARAEVVPVGRVGGGPPVVTRDPGSGALQEWGEEMRSAGRVDIVHRFDRRSLYRQVRANGGEQWWLHTSQAPTTVVWFGRDQLAATLQDVFS